MALHRLDPTPHTVTDTFDRDRPAVLSVDPGDTVVVRSLDASGYLEAQQVPGERRPQLIEGARGHCLAGPIEVDGARPGRTLAVHLVSLRPDGWGWTVAGGRDSAMNRRLGLADAPATWSLWSLDPDGGTGTDDGGHTVALAPFLGVIGLPPDEPGEHSTIPPRTQGGGNIDCRDLTAGSTLYLPVTVDGARLCLGDGHAAQGHGEVSGTAIECAMTTELVVDVVDDAPVAGVHAVTPDARLTFGFDPDLNEAAGAALDAMIAWMGHLWSLDRAAALRLASVAVDLHVTQVANETWGVHARLPHAAVR